MATSDFLRELLDDRLPPAASDWLGGACETVAAGTSDTDFCAKLSTASRHVRADPLAPSEGERARAGALVEGWDPERWTLRETARVALVLARPDLDAPSAERALEEAFRYADVGELCALYRSLAHLPRPERFLWRAKEGCRTNMLSVFEADVCDTPYPYRFFDDIAWNQAVVKALFVGAPAWRIFGLDRRLSPELARMVLDLADERRSAGRVVQHELWLCLGEHGGERGLAALERELESSHRRGVRAALYGLARAGATERVKRFGDATRDPELRASAHDALAGRTDQRVFRSLDPALQAG